MRGCAFELADYQVRYIERCLQKLLCRNVTTDYDVDDRFFELVTVSVPLAKKFEVGLLVVDGLTLAERVELQDWDAAKLVSKKPFVERLQCGPVSYTHLRAHET